MSDYKAIADRLVERGILDYLGNHREMSRPGYTELGRSYWLAGHEQMEDEALDAEDICHDWRVAGACMENLLVDVGNRRIVIADRVVKTFSVGITWYYGSNDGPRVNIHDDSLPLAIILAYLESSESENERGDFDD